MSHPPFRMRPDGGMMRPIPPSFSPPPGAAVPGRGLPWRIGLRACIALIAVAALPVEAPSRARPARHAPAAAARAVAAPAAAPEDGQAAPAVATAIRAEASGRIARFYATRGYWPLWIRNNAVRPEAEKFVGYLESADLDGLDPGRYDIDDLRRALRTARSGAPQDLARAELALSGALAAYVRDVRRAPSVRITYLDAELQPQRQREDEVLRMATLAPSFPAYVAAMGWMNPLYVQLRAGYARLRARTGAAEDERIIRLNLDRARILPGPWTRHVVVDAAAARLYYYGSGVQQGTMRVVVGADESPTPMLAGMVRYAILNPYWNVPTDLVQRRIAPRVLDGASFRSLRYEALSSWEADATRIDPRTIDWQAVASGAQELRVRQLPGGSNAMGRVKFMFPNDQGIYLHDTPDRALMRRPARHLSNGCVRLEYAAQLGRWLFGRPLAARTQAPEQDVALPQPVPVYLTYLTATPGAAGVTILNDAYGRDDRGR